MNNYYYRNLSKEMQGLYEEIFIYGTSYKSLLNDGFTLDEINLCLKQGGLRPITIRNNLNSTKENKILLL